MADERGDGNLAADEDRQREALLRAEFQDFRQTTQQALQEIQATLAGLALGPNQNRDYHRGRNVDEDRARPFWNRNPIPPHRQPAYEEDFSDDDYAEEVLGENRGAGRYRDQRDRDSREFRMKMDLPSFNGNLNIEDILDWLAEVERFFDYMHIPEDKKVKLVAYRLKGGASAWWEQLQVARARQGKTPVRSWQKMQRLIRGRFLPPDYEQTLFQKYQDCKQGSRTVQAYTEEFNRLTSRNDLRETEMQRVARYLSGLRYGIHDRVSTQIIYTLSEATNAATRAEAFLDKAKTSAGSRNYFDSARLATNKAKQPIYSQPSTPAVPDLASTSTQPKKTGTTPIVSPDTSKNNPYSRPNPIKCYRCGQPGHRSNECPQRRSINFIEPGGAEDRDREDDEELPLYDEEEVIGEDEGDLLSHSLVVRRLLLAPKTEEHPQRHNIFRTRCTVNKKVCDVIIDSGSSENIVSRAMVQKLGLKTEKHPSPYKIGWIKKGAETRVTDICRVSFSIGNKYIDEALCDVVDMDACHLILGRPWQFDVNATHRGRDNVYMFEKGGQKIVLGPMTEGDFPKVSQAKGKSVLLIGSEQQFLKEAKESRQLLALVVGEEMSDTLSAIPTIIQPMLEEF